MLKKAILLSGLIFFLPMLANAATALSVTATAGYGGRVDKASIPNIFVGTVVGTPIKFRFYPNPTTYKVYNITGVPAGATVSPATPAATNTSVYVTFPTGYVFTSNVALNGTFSGPPIAISAAPQTVLLGKQATLDGSPSTGAVVDSIVTDPIIPSYTWVQITGPTVTLTPSGSKATFTPTIEGTYQFRLTVTGGSTATTTVFVTTSVVTVARNSCQNCHQSNGIGVARNVFGNWSSSSHKQNIVMCPTCHVGTDTGGHPGYVSPITVDGTTFNYRFIAGNFCFTCHHAANNLHYNSETQLNNICSTCHIPNSHNPVATMSLALGAQHFNGYTSASNSNYQAAYVTPASQCANCHITTNGTLDTANDPALLQERLDWAASGHGNTKGSGFIAKDFKTLSGCVQCHTTTGFIAYSTAKMTTAWGTASDKSKGVLACNACHTDISDGTVRTCVPIKPYADDTYTNPDLGKSNLCMTCHSGLMSGRSIKAKAVASADFSDLAFTSSHYSAAAGTLFKSIGYEFGGNDYSNNWHFRHDRIGINNFTAYGFATGSGGPCVGCHLSSSEGHSFSPVAKDANDAVTAITSSSCAGCHTGPAYLDVPRMNTRKAKFASVLLALQKVLETRGIYYSDTEPHFFKSPGNTDPDNAFRNWGNADTMGAAFNFNLLKHEPGAYAHNMIYTKRLIYDSIDFLDNGAFDNSVRATITEMSGLDAIQKTTAIGYLTPGGTRP